MKSIKSRIKVVKNRIKSRIKGLNRINAVKTIISNRKRIEALKGRIKNGKSRIQALNVE